VQLYLALPFDSEGSHPRQDVLPVLFGQLPPVVSHILVSTILPPWRAKMSALLPNMLRVCCQDPSVFCTPGGHSFDQGMVLLCVGKLYLRVTIVIMILSEETNQHLRCGESQDGCVFPGSSAAAPNCAQRNHFQCRHSHVLVP
jgi:hypothetical protein